MRKNDFGNLEAESPGNLPADQLGNQGFHTLSRTPEFQDVQKTVVSLDNSRQ
jgi:hypothetical protein